MSETLCILLDLLHPAGDAAAKEQHSCYAAKEPKDDCQPADGHIDAMYFLKVRRTYRFQALFFFVRLLNVRANVFHGCFALDEQRPMFRRRAGRGRRGFDKSAHDVKFLINEWLERSDTNALFRIVADQFGQTSNRSHDSATCLVEVLEEVRLTGNDESARTRFGLQHSGEDIPDFGTNVECAVDRGLSLVLGRADKEDEDESDQERCARDK